MNKKPVLVVDDDPINRKLLEIMLEGLGYKFEDAHNGEEAVKKFSPDKYLCILMDARMPILNGLEATIKIREIEAGSPTRTPIIGLSANAFPEHRKECISWGMDNFMTKPFKRLELKAMLEKYEQPQFVHIQIDPNDPVNDFLKEVRDHREKTKDANFGTYAKKPPLEISMD